MTHSTRRNTKGCRLGDKVNSSIEKGYQTHARRTEYQGDKLITHKAHHNIQSLYATKNTRVFQYMMIAVILPVCHTLLYF